jgi:hypothetical protein
MASLFDPNLKLQWAKKHLDHLGEKIATFRQRNKQRTSTEDDPTNGWYLIRTEITHDAAVFEIALIVGDFVSCLRSCLDHLAWQLALFSSPNPSRDICFPICEKDSLDTQVRITKSTYGIPETAISIVKSFQPYHAGDAYKSTHLWRLNKLWNLDKHRHITPHGVVTDWLFNIRGVDGVDRYAAEFSFRGQQVEFIVEQLENGCIMKIPLAMKNQVHFNPNPDAATVDIRFGSDAEGIEIGYGGLVEIYECVAKTVIPGFAGFFPQSEATGTGF